MPTLAVDWSGDKRAADRPHRKLWVAEADDAGTLVRLEPSSRRAVVDELVARRQEAGLVVGLDAAFGYPAWFAAELGCSVGADVWAAADRVEAWVAARRPPFWGWAGSRRPADRGVWRTTESAARAAGWPVKSVFQVAGPGSVGTGTLAVLPALGELAAAGLAVWPFVDGPSATAPLVLEVYPRSFAAGVVKSRAADRAAFLATRWPGLPRALRHHAETSDDAFDAAVTALGLAAVAPITVPLLDCLPPDAAVEGWIWLPDQAPSKPRT